MKLIHVQGIYRHGTPPDVPTQSFLNADNITGIGLIPHSKNAEGDTIGYDVIVSTTDAYYAFCYTEGTDINGKVLFERLAIALTDPEENRIITVMPSPRLNYNGRQHRYLWGDHREMNCE